MAPVSGFTITLAPEHTLFTAPTLNSGKGKAMLKFNRVPPGQIAAIRGEAWNRLCDYVERHDELSVQPPLTLSNQGGLKVIGIGKFPNPTVLVKVTGNATGGAQNVGRILTGSSTADGVGNLTMPEGMTVPAADNALILDLNGNGTAVWGLSANTFHIGLVVGTVAAEGLYKGYTIVAVTNNTRKNCT